MYAITLHQPWASLIALGIKTVETRSWPAPARLMGQTIAIHAGKRVVKGPGDAIEQELRTRLGEDWSRHIPTGAVLATAVLAGIACVGHIDPLTDHAGHDLNTEIGRRNRDRGPVHRDCCVGWGTDPTDGAEVIAATATLVPADAAEIIAKLNCHHPRTTLITLA